MGGTLSSLKDAIYEPDKAQLFTPVELVELWSCFEALAMGQKHISKKAFAPPILPAVMPHEQLYALMLRSDTKAVSQAEQRVTWSAFLTGVAAFARGSRSARIDTIFELYSQNGLMSADKLRWLLAHARSGCGEDTAGAARDFGIAIASALTYASNGTALSKAEMHSWTEVVPSLSPCVECSLLEALLATGRAHAASKPLQKQSDDELPPPRPVEHVGECPVPVPMVVVGEQQNEGGALLEPELAWLLELSVGGPTSGVSSQAKRWSCIYSSGLHGLSLNRFESQCAGYAGATLLVVRCEAASETDGPLVLGALLDAPWKPSDKFFGGKGCSLVQLYPALHVYRPIGIASNFAFFNPPQTGVLRGGSYLGHASVPNTIGFGGQTARFRLGFEDDLKIVRWHNACTTYAAHPSEAGALVEGARQVLSLELWGSGGVEAETARRALKERAKRDADRAGKVDRAAMFGGGKQHGWDNETLAADKLILEAAGAHTFYSDQLEKLPQAPPAAAPPSNH